KHQNVPQQVVPVTRTTLVFRPLLRDGFWIEKTLAFQTGWVEKRGRPVLERASQPVIDRDTEAHLGALDHTLGCVSSQQLTQGPLPSPGANAKPRWNAPGKLDDAMIKKWSARLEAHAHAGTIYLHQDVIGEVHDEVQVHHPCEQPIDVCPTFAVREGGGRLYA